MFIFRALFWFAVVALLMPRAPDLGVMLHRPALHAVDRHSLDASLEAFRDAVFTRLDVIRGELAGAHPGRKLNALGSEAPSLLKPGPPASRG